MEINHYQPHQPQNSARPAVVVSPTIVQPTNQAQDAAQTQTAAAQAFQPVTGTSQYQASVEAAAPNSTPSQPFSASQQFAYEAPSYPGAKKHSGLFASATVVAAVALVAVGFFANTGLTNVAQSNASKEAKTFVAALNAGDTSKAYAMASADLHKQQSESQFTSAIGDVKASSPVVNTQSTAFNGRNLATYTMTEDGLAPTVDGSTTGTFTVSLVKSGLTNWKVESVAVQ